MCHANSVIMPYKKYRNQLRVFQTFPSSVLAILSSPLKLRIVFIKVFTDYIIRDVVNMNFLKLLVIAF